MSRGYSGKLSKRNSFKTGQDLEITSALVAMKTCPYAKVYSSLKVPVTEDKVTGIDLLVVVGHTCYILEMKNYNKRLSGTATQKTWIAETTAKRYNIMNPLQQNQYHCSRLASALMANGVSLVDITIKDYIVVPDECQVEAPAGVLKFILASSEFEQIFREEGRKKPPVLPPAKLIGVLERWRT